MIKGMHDDSHFALLGAWLFLFPEPHISSYFPHISSLRPIEGGGGRVLADLE